MTEELKCPFCGEELKSELLWDNMWWSHCPNVECDYFGEKLQNRFWQALIDGKKAQDALKIAIEALVYEADVGWDSDGSTADEALNKITSMPKQEV